MTVGLAVSVSLVSKMSVTVSQFFPFEVSALSDSIDVSVKVGWVISMVNAVTFNVFEIFQ